MSRELQVYNGANDSPIDLKVVPQNPELPAVYYNTSGNALWIWERGLRHWVRHAQSVPRQVYGGAGEPTTPPEDQNLASIYVDWATGDIYYWRQDNHTWN